ncbi:pachytene checkpoint protein 2 homolog [Ornithodoros turicata]|uniref:pachytene checkpoint protein 2 homolog n=1 Tax=Ornithodoros turicata TaxID=34597 RepID=UPI003138B89D
MLHINGGDDHTMEIISTTTVHMDILKSKKSSLTNDKMTEEVVNLLRKRGYPEVMKSFTGTFLDGQLEKVVAEYAGVRKADLNCSQFLPHYYHLNDGGAETEELEEDGLSAASQWVLPSTDFDGLWETLVYDTGIKDQLLQYASTALMFAEQCVDPNIISWNKVVLLHGPPGTGKTSLCKALAQKLSIRLGHRFHYGQLIEINSHSLFSKWFSESGKLVTKMFQKIQEFIDDPDALVFVLIDEVESLAHSRKAALGGSEPSDAIRVVNALLTQIDSIKRFSNVLVLATSNVTGSIDMAFVDRADIRQYIGYPSQNAVAQILKSCLQELIKTNIIRGDTNFLEDYSEGNRQRNIFQSLCTRCIGLSGRTLRKLPLIAHAMFATDACMTVEAFIVALSRAVERQHQEREDVASASQ